MSNGIDGISPLSGGLIAPDSQYTIQQDLRELKSLGGDTQTDMVRRAEASLLTQLNEAFVNGQSDGGNSQMGPLTDEDLTQGLTNQMMGGGNGYGGSPFSDSGFGGHQGYGGGSGGFDPLQALNNYSQEGLNAGSGFPAFGGGMPSWGGGGNEAVPTPPPWGGLGGFGQNGGQYGQANGGYGHANPFQENNMSLQTGSSFNLAGNDQLNGSVNGQTLSTSSMPSSHDDLFNANSEFQGGFQVGNTVGPGDDGSQTTQDIKMTVQGHQIDINTENGGTITVDGQQLKPGQTVGPVTVEDDGSVNINAYNDATGAQIHANIQGNSNGGLDLTLDHMQNINQAGGAMVDQAQNGSGSAPTGTNYF